MAPPKAVTGTVWIAGNIGHVMVPAMQGDPIGGTELHVQDAQRRERTFQAFRAGNAAMGEEPVIADVDAEQGDQQMAQQDARHSGPAEEIRHEGQKRDGVMEGNADQSIELLELAIVVGENWRYAGHDTAETRDTRRND